MEHWQRPCHSPLRDSQDGTGLGPTLRAPVSTCQAFSYRYHYTGHRVTTADFGRPAARHSLPDSVARVQLWAQSFRVFFFPWLSNPFVSFSLIRNSFYQEPAKKRWLKRSLSRLSAWFFLIYFDHFYWPALRSFCKSVLLCRLLYLWPKKVWDVMTHYTPLYYCSLRDISF